MKNFFYNWLPVFIWAGLIFYLSDQPGLNSGMSAFWDVFLRKLAHAFVFAVLNFLIFLALRGQEFNYRKTIVWALALAILYAVSDEIHQGFVPEREGKIQDVGIDSLGIIFSSLAQIFFWQRKKN
ncbi:MAG: VanZ family protein [Candidatus Portnoybacteria bacterium]|nr:VanZ family protein [Candidatus Portnoybacteria bacterium]